MASLRHSYPVTQPRGAEKSEGVQAEASVWKAENSLGEVNDLIPGNRRKEKKKPPKTGRGHRRSHYRSSPST